MEPASRVGASRSKHTVRAEGGCRTTEEAVAAREAPVPCVAACLGSQRPSLKLAFTVLAFAVVSPAPTCGWQVWHGESGPDISRRFSRILHTSRREHQPGPSSRPSREGSRLASK